MVRFRDRGEEADALIQKFNERGVFDEPYHPAFVDVLVDLAIQSVQAQIGVKIDGIYGPKTGRAFDAFTGELIPVQVICVGDLRGDLSIGEMALNIGVKEGNDGAQEVGGNNQGPWVAKYHRVSADKLDPSWAWCAAFASWCFREASEELSEILDRDVKMPFSYTGGAQNISRQLKPIRAGEAPVPGDLCIWWRGKTRTWKGHVGIVHQVIGDHVFILEGNQGGYPAKVKTFCYKLSDMPKLIGFYQPKPK